MIYTEVNANIDLGQILIGISLILTAAAGAGLLGKQLRGITTQVNGRKKDDPTLSQDIAELNTVVKDMKDTLALINSNQEKLSTTVLENQQTLIEHLSQHLEDRSKQG
jgi:hypothetical protein